jgi:hypothetical protein
MNVNELAPQTRGSLGIARASLAEAFTTGEANGG